MNNALGFFVVIKFVTTPTERIGVERGMRREILAVQMPYGFILFYNFFKQSRQAPSEFHRNVIPVVISVLFPCFNEIFVRGVYIRGGGVTRPDIVEIATTHSYPRSVVREKQCRTHARRLNSLFDVIGITVVIAAPQSNGAALHLYIHSVSAAGAIIYHHIRINGQNFIEKFIQSVDIREFGDTVAPRLVVSHIRQSVDVEILTIPIYTRFFYQVCQQREEIIAGFFYAHVQKDLTVVLTFFIDKPLRVFFVFVGVLHRSFEFEPQQ